MDTNNRGIVLLCGVPATLGLRLARSLQEHGMETRVLTPAGAADPTSGLRELPVNLNDPAAIAAQLTALDRPLRALINRAAQPLAVPPLDGKMVLGDIAYAPYELYRGVIRQMHGGGNIVSLFGDTGPRPEPHALTLPALKKITQDLRPAATAAGVRMNGVSVRFVPDVTEAASDRILEARIRTVVRLALTDDPGMDGEYLRGYTPEALAD